MKADLEHSKNQGLMLSASRANQHLLHVFGQKLLRNSLLQILKQDCLRVAEDK